MSEYKGKKAMPLDDRAWQLIAYYRWIAERSVQYVDQVSVTRGDVARHTGLSRTHVTRLLDKMCDEGMLVRDASYVGKRTRYRYFLSEGVCDSLYRQEEISWRDFDDD